MPGGKSRGRRIVACASVDHSESDHPNSKRIQKYHPAEEIREPSAMDDGENHRLSAAETARTIIEVNSKGALVFTEDIDDCEQKALWPDVPYLTDEHGDIYIEATEEDDIWQNFISDDGDEILVQVLIGSAKILTDIEASGSSVFHSDIDDVFSNDDDLDNDTEEDDFAIFKDEDNVDDAYNLTSEISVDWPHAETMQAAHPISFAQKIAEAVSKRKLNWLDQPSASVIIQGLLRPVFGEEHKLTKKYMITSDGGSNRGQHLVKHTKDNKEGEMNNDGVTFFKLEAINIQLVSAFGNKSAVKVQDFHQAHPDVIVHSAAKIISRLKCGSEKTTQAMIALCWRQKGIQVQEVSIIGLDSLGFDLRVCSGTQIQTLRFSFNARATSEFSAEKQARDILFPRVQQQHRIGNQL